MTWICLNVCNMLLEAWHGRIVCHKCIKDWNNNSPQMSGYILAVDSRLKHSYFYKFVMGWSFQFMKCWREVEEDSAKIERKIENNQGVAQKN